jgi:DNA-binding NarL/FixJ family response regulator
MIRVLLIDDHDLIRGGLRRAFERDGDFTVVGEADTVATGLSLAAEHTPDVVVVDVNLPDGNGLDAAQRMRSLFPTLGIVVLTMYDDDEHLFGALDAQASAFVAKSAPTEAVLSAARHAASSPGAFSAASPCPSSRSGSTSASPRPRPTSPSSTRSWARPTAVRRSSRRYGSGCCV